PNTSRRSSSAPKVMRPLSTWGSRSGQQLRFRVITKSRVASGQSMPTAARRVTTLWTIGSHPPSTDRRTRTVRPTPRRQSRRALMRTFPRVAYVPPVVTALSIRRGQWSAQRRARHGSSAVIAVLVIDLVRPDRHRSRRPAVVDVKPTEHALDRDRLG